MERRGKPRKNETGRSDADATRRPVGSDPAFGVGRREFIGAAAALAAGAAIVGGPTVRRARAADRPGRGGARNLIFAVADGLSSGTIQLADLFIRQAAGRPSNWMDLFRRAEARRAWVETSAADSIVTDSAAAATAWGIGLRVNNGSIGRAPDGRLLSPILVRAKESGRATGLVTTTRLTHATPAGFIASLPTGRDDEAAIAEQMIDRGVDVMLGGGAHYFPAALIEGQSDLHVVRTRDDLRAGIHRPGKRVLGLFAEQHMAYEMDRPASQPTLAEMTRAALDRLAAHPGGFVVQIEGGRVDHAGHANDAGALIRDQQAFDEALAVAIAFADERGDTLLIATTDHGNANPGLTEYGEKGNRGFARVHEWRRSFEWIMAQARPAGPDIAPDRLREIVREATGATLSDDELSLLARARRGEPTDPFLTAGRGTGPLGSVLANHFGVAFLSVNHTSDYVELLALGPGSERLPPFLSHADVHDLMANALDLPPAKEM